MLQQTLGNEEVPAIVSAHAICSSCNPLALEECQSRTPFQLKAMLRLGQQDKLKEVDCDFDSQFWIFWNLDLW